MNKEDKHIKRKINILKSIFGLGKKHFPMIANVIRSRKIRQQFKREYLAENLQKSIELVEATRRLPYPEVLRRFSSNSTAGKYSTKRINIEVNNTCNLDCLMCRPGLSNRPKGTMDNNLLSNIAAKVSGAGFREIELHTIGEPLAHPGLDKVFSVFRKQALNIGLTTNGQLLDKCLDILKEFTDVCSNLSFSIDAATKEKYEKIRAGGQWKKMNENLELAKRELKGHNLSISMTISRDNIGEVGGFIERFRSFVRHPYRDLNFGFINSLSPDTRYFNEMNLFKTHTYPNRPCKMVFSPTGHILIDGRVSVCCRDYNGDLVIGNAAEASFDDIFNNEALKTLQASHRSGDIDRYPLCRNCYFIDERINTAFGNIMQYVLFYYPGKDAHYYQEIVDAFVTLFTSGTYPEEYRKIISRLQVKGTLD